MDRALQSTGHARMKTKYELRAYRVEIGGKTIPPIVKRYSSVYPLEAEMFRFKQCYPLAKLSVLDLQKNHFIRFT